MEGEWQGYWVLDNADGWSSIEAGCSTAMWATLSPILGNRAARQRAPKGIAVTKPASPYSPAASWFH
jgi:hypothetical protein